MNKFLLMISTLLILLTGCQSKDEVVEAISFNPTEYNVMIIPEESIEEIDEIYIDAIIDLKAEYPYEFADAKTVEIDPTEMDIPLDTKGTTLIIQKNGQTVAQLSRNMPKDEIMEQLEVTLEEDKKDALN